MAYNWSQWNGISQDAYNKEKQRITQKITEYGAKGDLASIQKAQKHQQMFEQAYKGIDPNTGQKFSSSQNQPAQTVQTPQFNITPSSLFGNVYDNPLVKSYLGSSGIDQDSLLNSARSSVQGQLDLLTAQNQKLVDRANQQYNRNTGLIDTDVGKAKDDLEKASHLDRLRAKEALVFSGNSDSSAGLADMETRVNLAKQENLTDIYDQASRQKEDLTNSYNLSLQELQDRLDSFDVEGNTSKIYQELYKNALAEDKQQKDMLWNLINMQNENNQFLAPYYFQTADKQADVNMDLFKFNNLSADQQNKVLLDMYKHVNPSGDAQLNANTEMFKWGNPSANSLVQAQSSANVANINGQYGLQRQQIASAAQLQASQIAAAARIEAANIAKTDPSKVASQADLEIFVKNLVPGEDTRDSAQSVIDQMYSNRQIDEASYRAYSAVNKSYWDEVSKQEQVAAKQSSQFWNQDPSSVFNYLANMGYNMGAGGLGAITSPNNSQPSSQPTSSNSILNWLANFGYNMGANGLGKQ